MVETSLTPPSPLDHGGDGMYHGSRTCAAALAFETVHSGGVAEVKVRVG